MNQSFDIQTYMTKGVERVVSDALKATLRDPKESAFMENGKAPVKSGLLSQGLSESYNNSPPHAGLSGATMHMRGLLCLRGMHTIAYGKIVSKADAQSAQFDLWGQIYTITI